MAPARCEIRREADAAAFAARVEPWLLEREAEHNVLLGLLPKLSSGRHEFDAPIYLASLEQEGRVVGCAFRTPPYKLGLTRFPPGVEDRLAADLGSVYDALPAVLGREADATRFADAWCRRTGGRWAVGMHQRIHRLDTLLPPAAVPAGALRLPAADERPLVVEWLDAFARESRIGGSASDVLADILIGGDDLFLWDDGGPVAMAAVPAYTPHGARVGYVYTPPDRRGRGYATAAVAELSRQLLAAGRRFCMLYTDIANPVSNRIYERLGYGPVVDVVDVDFRA
jgi:RimJ/RimL family protein N-acetyltransferase